MSDRLTLSRAIEDAGIERAKAERVASAIVDLIHDQVATKADVAASAAGLRADVMAVRTDLKAADASLRSAIQASEGRLTANASRAGGGSVRAALWCAASLAAALTPNKKHH